MERRVYKRRCQVCGEKDYSVRSRKGKLQRRGIRVCDPCMERVAFCEFNGVLLEGDLGVSYLKLKYFEKPIYYHWGIFTYESGREISPKVLKRLKSEDELIALLESGGEIDNDFLKNEFIYFDFCYHIRESDREKLINHIKENM
jgi:hypothetical protein